jgi:tripartite ATP-independent transporter DctP family solute receptor
MTIAVTGTVDRRRAWRLRALGLALALLAHMTVPLPAAAVDVRFGYMLPTTHPFHAAAQEVAKLAKERTAGRVDVRLFPASQLGDEKAQTEQVMLGSLQIFLGTYGMLGNWLPEISVFEAPYAFKDLKHYRKVVASELFKSSGEKLVAQTGVRIVDSWYLGNRHVVSRNFAVNSPDDLKGKKLRVPEAPIYVEMARAMGGTPTPFAYAEVYLALSQGVLDAAENPLSGLWTQKWHEVCKYLALTSHMLQNLTVIANEKALQGLSAEDRSALLSAIREVGEKVSQKVLDEEQGMVEKVKARGVTVTQPDIRVFQKRAVEALPAKFADKWGKGVYERIQAMAD